MFNIPRLRMWCWCSLWISAAIFPLWWNDRLSQTPTKKTYNNNNKSRRFGLLGQCAGWFLSLWSEFLCMGGGDVRVSTWSADTHHGVAIHFYDLLFPAVSNSPASNTTRLESQTFQTGAHPFVNISCSRSKNTRTWHQYCQTGHWNPQ